MPLELHPAISIVIGQALGATAMTLLLAVFARRFRKGYLRQWIGSWGALSAVYVANLLAVDASPVLVRITSIVIGCAFSLHLLYLLFGTFELTRHLSVRLRTRRWVIPATAVFGAGVAAVLSPTALTILMCSISAITALICSLWILIFRGRHSAPGLLLFGGALFGRAVADLVTSVLVAANTSAPADATFVEFAVALVVGVGMIVALLDDEREAAVLAASEIEHLAYNDPLTGLPNRSLFFDRVIISIAQATRQQHSVAVLFLDIDRFKDINDSLGHSLGDALLRAAAKRIRDCLRQGDTLSRFGGDEFTVLLPRIERVDDASSVASKILNTIRLPFQLAGRELVVSCSIGISLYPSDGLDAETLVKNADTAMYRAKESGRDNYQLFTPELNSRAVERLDLENRLRRASQTDELLLYYQPIVNLEKNTIHGFEALLRWRHPELGLLPPSQFIEAAEVSGLTVPIGEWVLREACVQAREWMIGHGVELAVSVNISARQLQEPELVEQVKRALKESGLPPRLLDLEITETNAMRNAEASSRVLHELRGLGVRIAMDDFGTGYSSLSYLRRFPVDLLKLDSSFLREIDRSTDSAIAIAVIEMARALGMKVVAEGVETDEQYDFLLRHGCELGQGYFFSEPMSADDCSDYIVTNTVPRLSTGPIHVPRLELRRPPGTAVPARLDTVVAPRRKSGQYRKSELQRMYGRQHDLISDN